MGCNLQLHDFRFQNSTFLGKVVSVKYYLEIKFLINYIQSSYNKTIKSVFKNHIIFIIVCKYLKTKKKKQLSYYSNNNICKCLKIIKKISKNIFGKS